MMNRSKIFIDHEKKNAQDSTYWMAEIFFHKDELWKLQNAGF